MLSSAAGFLTETQQSITQAYPRFADNPPGLSVGERQTWAPGRTLETFFNARLSISPRQFSEMVEQLCESAIAVGHEVIEAAKNEPAWRDVANTWCMPGTMVWSRYAVKKQPCISEVWMLPFRKLVSQVLAHQKRVGSRLVALNSWRRVRAE